MKRLIPLALAAFWAGCAAPKPEPARPLAPVAATTAAVAQIPPAPGSPNFELRFFEVVATPEEDALEYAQVFMDGRLQGRTEIAAKSRPKLWRSQIPEGNHPMRFEVWDSTDGVSGVRRPEDMQPGERFFRVEPGKKTSVTLKFTDRGRQSLFYVTRD
jgi:hypothetical protein